MIQNPYNHNLALTMSVGKYEHAVIKFFWDKWKQTEAQNLLFLEGVLDRMNMNVAQYFNANIMVDINPLSIVVPKKLSTNNDNGSH